MQNSVVWSEIAVADLKRAAVFYEKLLDAELAFDKFGPFRIALFPHGDQGVGGCLVHGEGYEPSPKGTVTYLAATPGTGAALQRASGGGGAAATPRPRTRFPWDRGWIAHGQDCEGNPIGLHAMS